MKVEPRTALRFRLFVTMGLVVLRVLCCALGTLVPNAAQVRQLSAVIGEVRELAECSRIAVREALRGRLNLRSVAC